MRAQLFSMDFLVSIVFVVLALGLLVNVFDFSQRSTLRGVAFSGKADLLAEVVVSGLAPPRVPLFCVSYSNGTSSCAGFSCHGDVLAAQRVVSCPQGLCVAEVRTCA